MTDNQTIPLTVKITMHSEPFRDEPEGADSYYAALGRALVLCGRFENVLTSTILAINNLPEAKELRPKNVPVFFKQRAKLWRKFFCEIHALEHLRDAAMSLISEADDANEDRVVIVHGHFHEFIAENPLTARFNMHRYKDDKIIFKRYDVTIEMLENLARTFDALNTRLLPIIWGVTAIHPPRLHDKSQEPSGLL